MIDEVADAMIDWEMVVKEAPTVTIVDSARKLAIAATSDDCNEVPQESTDTLLAHVEATA